MSRPVSIITTPRQPRAYYEAKRKELRAHVSPCETQCGVCDGARNQLDRELQEILKGEWA